MKQNNGNNKNRPTGFQMSKKTNVWLNVAMNAAAFTKQDDRWACEWAGLQKPRGFCSSCVCVRLSSSVTPSAPVARWCPRPCYRESCQRRWSRLWPDRVVAVQRRDGVLTSVRQNIYLTTSELGIDRLSLHEPARHNLKSFCRHQL